MNLPVSILHKSPKMKRWTLFLAAICLLCFFSCSKNKGTGGADTGLVGKWVLAKSCVCNVCRDSNAIDNSQTIQIISNGQVQLSGLVGNVEEQYPGTYTVTRQQGGDILNITLDAPAPPNFLYIPGSVIFSKTATTLLLNLNTPFANPCLYQNTYVPVSK
jgi:hypothetical protein